jgi:hypothetical protein
MDIPVLVCFSTLGESASSGIGDEWTPLGPALLAVVVWPRRFRRRRKMNAAIAIKIRATAVTPTAMPAMAPVDIPCDPESSDRAVLVVAVAEELPVRLRLRLNDVGTEEVGVGKATPFFITTWICFTQTGAGFSASRVVIGIGTPVPDVWHASPTTLSAKGSM